MKLKRSLHVALLGAVLATRALAQTEADIASLLPKAQRGNAIAQYNLGLAYLNGKGVALDRIEAYVWLSLAHEGGFRGKALSVVAAGLEPADFETARKRLAERRAALNLKAAAAPAKTEAAETETAIPVVRTDAPAAAPAAPAPAPAQNPSLTQELASAVADKQQLSDELSKSWGETEELKKQMAANQATTDLLTAQISKLNGERDSLASKLNALTAEAVSLRTDRDNARALGVQAETALAQANTQKAALESTLREVQSSTATDKKWMSDELAKSFQEVSALKSQLAAAATTAAAAASAAPAYPDLSDKVKELEANLAATTAEAMAAKQEAQRLTDDRIDREKQLLAVQQQSAESATARAALLQEIESLRRAAATPVAPAYPDLREEVAALKSAAGQAEQKIAALAQAKETAEKNLAKKPAAPSYPDLSAKVAELEASLVAVTTDAKAAQQEVRTLQRAAATPVAPAYPDLREQVATLESQVATLKSEGTRAREQIAALGLAKAAAEKSLAQTPAAPTYPDLSGKVKELEANLATLSAKAAAAQQEATRLADDRIDREKQLLAVQQQSAELAAARDSLQQEIQTLRSAPATPAAPAYPDLREQVTALESQLAAAKSDASQQTAALAEAKAALAKASAATPAAPAYPDLSDRVKELEAALAARSVDTANADALAQAKADAAQKLAAAEQSRTELAQQFDEFKRSALANQRENLNRQAQITMLESEKAALRQQSTADQTRLAELSAQLTASRRKAEEVYPTAPAYPDQRARVEQLEAELTKTNEQANGMIAVLNRSQQEAKAAAEQAEQLRATIRELENRAAATAPVYPDLREQVSNLEIQLEAARALPKNAVSPTEFAKLKQELSDTKQKLATTLKGYALIEQERDALASRPAPAPVAAAPTYPDLREKVASLEAALSASKAAGPAYPDLREQVSNLEIQLDAARSLPKDYVSPKEFSELKQQLADTQEKLATTLKGYRLIEKERDELAAKPGQAGSAPSDIARLTEAYSALQRTNAQNERDLVLLRAQLQQTPAAQTGAPTKVAAAPVPVTPRVVAAPAAPPPSSVVAAAPVAPAVRRTHVVAAGDTLVKISQRYYGNPNNWQPIYDANRELLGPKGTLKVGTELRIP